jgi:hypothetical protein
MENEVFAKNSSSKTCKRVCDDDALVELKAILAALGGSSNTTPTMFNVTLGVINTEQSLTLPANTKRFILKTRGNTLLKISYVATESGTKYVTLTKNGVFTDDNFYTAQTIYFQSPSTGDVVEVVAYS